MTAYWISIYREIRQEALAALDGGALRDMRIMPGVTSASVR